MNKIDVSKMYSKEALTYLKFLLNSGVLLPNKAGMEFFHTKLLPSYLNELYKK